MTINKFQWDVIVQAVGIYNNTNSREGISTRLEFDFDQYNSWGFSLTFGNTKVNTVEELDEFIEYISSLRSSLSAINVIDDVVFWSEKEYNNWVKESLGMTFSQFMRYKDNQSFKLYEAIVNGNSRAIKNFMSGRFFGE